ncbi:hypothetical protein Tco_0851442 [Tanacetum coccineum]
MSTSARLRRNLTDLLRIMEIEPDIENMTLNGYLDYEAEKERRLWDNVRSRRSPTNYDEADVDSFHQNKSNRDVIQPLIPTTLHTTPPNEDYVAPATKPILEKLLEDKILNVAMVDEEVDPTRDLEEPERLLIEYPHFMEIHVHLVITKLEPFIHTQPLSPLYRIFESYKSSTKLYKVDREMKFPSSSPETSRDSTRHFGPPRGLKFLLHTLNETVISTKLLQDDAHGEVKCKYLARNARIGPITRALGVKEDRV